MLYLILNKGKGQVEKNETYAIQLHIFLICIADFIFRILAARKHTFTQKVKHMQTVRYFGPG